MVGKPSIRWGGKTRKIMPSCHNAPHHHPYTVKGGVAIVVVVKET